MGKTRIVVLQMKEILYTAIFVALGILLILLLVFMFVGKKEDTVQSTQENSVQYTAGVYNSAIKLGENVLNLEVVVDKDHINSVRLLNIDESVATMYPLIVPSLSRIEEQLVDGVSLSDLTYSEESKFTQMMLVDAIEDTLAKAICIEVTE